ncbi:iron-containing alcohol dehydrogenase, partial [Salmonella sp. hn-h4]|nr:iron-containing alcohol dehydrogenase [Salmonella sp. hn-h4]
MKPFEFRTVPSMLVEWSGAKRLGEILSSRFTARKALIVTDGGLVKAGLLQPVEKNLREQGFDVVVFDQVIADPPEAIVLD